MTREEQARAITDNLDAALRAATSGSYTTVERYQLQSAVTAAESLVARGRRPTGVYTWTWDQLQKLYQAALVQLPKPAARVAYTPGSGLVQAPKTYAELVAEAKAAGLTQQAPLMATRFVPASATTTGVGFETSMAAERSDAIAASSQAAGAGVDDVAEEVVEEYGAYYGPSFYERHKTAIWVTGGLALVGGAVLGVRHWRG